MAFKKFEEEQGEATVRRTWTEVYIRQRDFYHVSATNTYGYHELRERAQLLPDNFPADHGLYPGNPQDYEEYF